MIGMLVTAVYSSAEINRLVFTIIHICTLNMAKRIRRAPDRLDPPFLQSEKFVMRYKKEAALVGGLYTLRERH
jgi:hypothetical protein